MMYVTSLGLDKKMYVRSSRLRKEMYVTSTGMGKKIYVTYYGMGKKMYVKSSGLGEKMCDVFTVSLLSTRSHHKCQIFYVYFASDILPLNNPNTWCL